MERNSQHFKTAHAATAVMQLCIGGYTVVTKGALNGGINQLVFLTYRGAIGLLLLAPTAYFCEIKKRPPITRYHLVSFFILGLTGVFGAPILYVAGLGYTNPTYVAAAQPSVPILTFVIILIMGTETLILGKLEGKVKAGGILVCVSGAILMLLLKGPAIIGSSGLEQYAVQINHFRTEATAGWLMSHLSGFGIDRWHIGVLCLIGQCISISTYLSLLGPILAKYPASISVTAYGHFSGLILTIISTFLFTNCNSTDWILTRSELLAVLYSGIVVSALNYALGTWSNKILGPVIMSLYTPLQPLASSLLSTVFLSSAIYLGSIIGGIFIIAGLYMFTWASHIERQATSTEATKKGLANPPPPQADGVSEPFLHKDSAIAYNQSSHVLKINC